MNIIQLLERSRASDAFREAVVRFLRDGQPNDRVAYNGYAPPVKVERTLMQALEQYPELELESIEIRGTSGCEYFRGTMELRTMAEERRIKFHWDCKWRAEQQGWRDYFGFPDQARAAREFGHDCFRAWTEDGVTSLLAAAVEDAGEAVPA